MVQPRCCLGGGVTAGLDAAAEACGSSDRRRWGRRRARRRQVLGDGQAGRDRTVAGLAAPRSARRDSATIFRSEPTSVAAVRGSRRTWGVTLFAPFLPRAERLAHATGWYERGVDAKKPPHFRLSRTVTPTAGTERCREARRIHAECAVSGECVSIRGFIRPGRSWLLGPGASFDRTMTPEPVASQGTLLQLLQSSSWTRVRAMRRAHVSTREPARASRSEVSLVRGSRVAVGNSRGVIEAVGVSFTRLHERRTEAGFQGDPVSGRYMRWSAVVPLGPAFTFLSLRQRTT